MFLRNFLKHSTLIIFFFSLKNISSILLHFIASKFCWLPLNSETGRSSKLKLDGNLTLGRDFSQNWSLANIEHLNKGLIRSGKCDYLEMIIILQKYFSKLKFYLNISWIISFTKITSSSI